MEARNRIARDLEQLRAAVEALARDRGVDPPDDTVFELLEFLERLDVHPGQFLTAVFDSSCNHAEPA